jgi:hypothetical protein
MHTRRALLLRELNCTRKRSSSHTTTTCSNTTRAPQFVPQKHQFAPHTRDLYASQQKLQFAPPQQKDEFSAHTKGGARGCSQTHGCLEPAPHASAYANVSTREHTSTSEHTSERHESAPHARASVPADVALAHDTRAAELAHDISTSTTERAHDTRAHHTSTTERAHHTTTTRAAASRSSITTCEQATCEYAGAATEPPPTCTHTPSTHTHRERREGRDAYPERVLANREHAYTSVSNRERVGAETARELRPPATAREVRAPEFARALGAQTARELTTSTARQLTRARSA